MPAVGLDISDKSIRFLGFRKEKGAFRIDRYAERSLPAGIVVAGKIKDAKKMKEVLMDFKEEHGLEFVRVSLPEEQGYLFQMQIPRVHRREIKESIALSLEEHAPVKALESVFDYEIVREASDGFVLQVSAIPSTIVESYADIFIASGLIPMSFEIEAQAIARAVVPQNAMGTYMVVDFGQTRTGIAIVSGGIVVFTSTIEIGGALITEAISSKLSLPSAAAEVLKRERGLVRERHKGKEDIFPVVLAAAATLRDDINRHFVYWHTHKEDEAPAHRTIEKLILCGGEANLRGLPEYLARSMRVKVELADVWSNVITPPAYLPEIPRNDSLTYATAIGLALAEATA
ncbi:pilus assembly protein PilM [Candidatus Parcubacteria bacterium]|nr:pilus assembly protein PilM [Candidatus Parcubacteria bacterium]